MKPVKILLILVFLIGFTHQFAILAQPGRRIDPVILFSYKPGFKNVILPLKEKKVLWYSTGKDTALQSSVVTRVRSDSIYLNGEGFLMKDLSVIKFNVNNSQVASPSYVIPRPVFVPTFYYRNDSSSWDIFYPPENVYRNHFTFSGYMKEVNHYVKRDKIEKYRSPAVFNNFIKLNLSKLAHLEISLGYECRLSKKITWENECSYIIGIKSADAYYTIPYPIWNYTGITFLTYPKFYCLDSRTYLSPVLSYRYLFFTGVRASYLGDGNGSLQDQYRSDIGLSARVGHMVRYGNFILDGYLGLGCKIVMVHQLLYGNYSAHDESHISWVNPDHSPEVNNITQYWPIVNLGVMIGVGF